MVQANRWTVDEFTSNAAAFLEAAKSQGPQLVIAKDTRFTMTCEDLAKKPDLGEFLARGGPGGDED